MTGRNRAQPSGVGRQRVRVTIEELTAHAATDPQLLRLLLGEPQALLRTADLDDESILASRCELGDQDRSDAAAAELDRMPREAREHEPSLSSTVIATVSSVVTSAPPRRG